VSPDHIRLIPSTITKLNIALPNEDYEQVAVSSFQAAICSLSNLQHLILRGSSLASLELVSESLEIVDMSGVGKAIFITTIRCPKLRKLTVRCMVRRIGQQETEVLIGDVRFSEVDIIRVASNGYHNYNHLKDVDVVAVASDCILSNECEDFY
jgi:hypothetical protein